MLFLNILFSVWFVIWLFFAWQKHEMLQVLTVAMINISEKEEEPNEV